MTIDPLAALSEGYCPACAHRLEVGEHAPECLTCGVSWELTDGVTSDSWLRCQVLAECSPRWEQLFAAIKLGYLHEYPMETVVDMAWGSIGRQG